MSIGMELMGMVECEQCGDPFTVTEDGGKVCGGCKASLAHVVALQEIDTLKAQLAAAEATIERLTRERDGAKVTLEQERRVIDGHIQRAEKAEADLDVMRRSLERVQGLLDEERRDRVRVEAERDAARAFKKYVHDRLDEAGIPVDPPGPHRDAGCRIGQRLDVLFSQLDAARADKRAAMKRVREACIGALFTCQSHTLAEAVECNLPCAHQREMKLIRAVDLAALEDKP